MFIGDAATARFELAINLGFADPGFNLSPTSPRKCYLVSLLFCLLVTEEFEALQIKLVKQETSEAES